VHLSGIISHCLGLGKDENEEEFPLCMAIGMAWEDWAVGLWPDMEWQPGEQELNGIFGSPDGRSFVDDMENPEGGYGLLEEFKCTWQSRRTHGDILKETKWLWQIGGYCKMMQLRHARMHILWACGEYRFGPPKPEYYTYSLEFTKEELDKLWVNVILKNKDNAKSEEH
jgi:hypothetical protein